MWGLMGRAFVVVQKRRIAVKKRFICITLSLLITESALLLPHSPSISADLGAVVANGNKLATLDGRLFTLFGINYVGGPDRSWTMWQADKFDTNQINAHFVQAKAAGANTIRVFVRSPLNTELTSGNWSKLDAVVTLAEQNGLRLIVTMNDYREDDLNKVVALDKAVAARYAGRGTILAIDLKNEPHYQDLVTTIYPGTTPPLQTDTLIKQYGEQMNQAATDAWRQNDGKSLVPARYSSREAYIYANNYKLYQTFYAEAGKWVTDRGYTVTSLDYTQSAEGAKWKPLLDAWNSTLATWINTRMQAIRSVDPNRMVTVGYSDLVMGQMAANRALSMVCIHRYPTASLGGMQQAFKLVDYYHKNLGDKPLIFGEFGFSNATYDMSTASLSEAALMLYSLNQGFAGVAKWSLYDVAEGFNAEQQNYGLYRIDYSAKLAVTSMMALGRYAQGSNLPSSTFSLDNDPSGSGLRYVYSAGDAFFVAAYRYYDPNGKLSMESGEKSQLFVTWPQSNQIRIIATATTNLRINPLALFGVKAANDASLKRSDGADIAFGRDGDGIIFTADAGQTYTLTLGAMPLDARIEIVWPHGNLPVAKAQQANIGAYVFLKDTKTVACPQSVGTARLWRALNNGVEEEVKAATTRSTIVNGIPVNVWGFNDVDVKAANDAGNKYYFRMSIDGTTSRSSTWSHGADARTYAPTTDTPTSVLASAPGQVDAKIEIVWPHGSLPVAQATKVNVAAYLFQHGTLVSGPSAWSPTVRLWRSLNNGFEEQVAIGQKVMKTVGTVTFPTWEFNDVDVSAARDGGNKYYFHVTVDGTESYGNIWAHGADARTYFPEQDVPNPGASCN
jgi:hypothetical protein